MWIVTNNTPYAADGTWIQDKDANQVWLVVLKATFDILVDGSTKRAAVQEPVLRMAQPSGDFGESSLIYDADLLGIKAGTDVLVNGQAWAPSGKAVEYVDVRLKIGSIDKNLRIFGDRKWVKGLSGRLSISSCESFTSMPITFERSFGGWDKSASDPVDHRLYSRNSVGTGFSLSEKSCMGKQLPNVEYINHLIGSWKDRPPPAGLNAVDSAWSPRRELAGTYDENWEKTRLPLWAEDFDPRYNNCAPADQQSIGFLKGGEKMSLLNLSKNGRLDFTLPRIYPFFRTRIGKERVEHRAQLCTVIVEPDISRVIMAWQTSLVCNHQVDELDETVVTQKRIIK